MPNLQAVRCKMLFFYGVALIRFIFPHAVCLGLRGGGRDSWGGGLRAGTWYSNSQEGQPREMKPESLAWKEALRISCWFFKGGRSIGSVSNLQRECH